MQNMPLLQESPDVFGFTFEEAGTLCKLEPVNKQQHPDVCLCVGRPCISQKSPDKISGKTLRAIVRAGG
jgi:hypothetical protein